MQDASESVLREIAARVAARVSRAPRTALPGSYALVVLSGDDAGVRESLARLAANREPIVAVAEPGAAGALATAHAAAGGSLTVVDAESEEFTIESVLAGASRVVAPSIDLGLAGRVASLRPDSYASRVLVRALLDGAAVEATLCERDFRVSERAPEGARRAVAEIEAKLSDLGLRVARAPVAKGAAAAGGAERRHADAVYSTVAAVSPSSVYGAGRAHPSQERFALPATVGEFVEFLEKRACTIESGQPCVECGACEARGF